MRIDVPFFAAKPTKENPEGVHCVETSLRMILGYFEPGNQYSLEELEEITGKKPEKGSWVLQFCLWFMNNGYEVVNISPFSYKSFEQDGIAYIAKEYGKEIVEWQKNHTNWEAAQQQVSEFIQRAEVIQRKAVVKDIAHGIDNNYVARVSVNQRVLQRKDGFHGHSVVPIEVTDSEVIFHDPGLPAKEASSLSIEVFQEAMDSFGNELQLLKLR